MDQDKLYQAANDGIRDLVTRVLTISIALLAAAVAFARAVGIERFPLKAFAWCVVLLALCILFGILCLMAMISSFANNEPDAARNGWVVATAAIHLLLFLAALVPMLLITLGVQKAKQEESSPPGLESADREAERVRDGFRASIQVEMRHFPQDANEIEIPANGEVAQDYTVRSGCTLIGVRLPPTKNHDLRFGMSTDRTIHSHPTLYSDADGANFFRIWLTNSSNAELALQQTQYPVLQYCGVQ